MQTVTLVREETSDQGTFGRIFVDNSWWYSGELPWRDNAKNISCIPAGEYKCDFTYSPAFSRFMYLVHPVEGRSGIRIHSANFMGDDTKGFRRQLYGCIALGSKRGTLDGQKAVLMSRVAVRNFEIKLEREPFELDIKNEFTF